MKKNSNLRLLPFLSSVALLILLTPALFAQIKATDTQPKDGTVADKPIRSLRIWFDDVPNVGNSEVTITGPTEGTKAQGLHSMGEQDLMARISGPMPDGEYTVSWKTAGGDDKTAEGSFKFTVKRATDSQPQGAAAKASPQPQFPATPDMPIDVGIVLYPGFEPLDVFGPVEMFMNVGAENLRVHMIAEEKGLVPASAGAYPAAIGPKVMADYGFDDAPALDVLLVPGGFGTLEQVNNERLLSWLRERSATTSLTTSVCSGSAILAKAGLLEGHKATGNKQLFTYLASFGPNSEWIKEARWVEDRNIVTSSGVSAGMDMALALIERWFGEEVAVGIANGTEYEWHRDSSHDPFTKFLDQGMGGTAASLASDK